MFLQYLLVVIAVNVKIAVRVTIFKLIRDSECHKAVVCDSEVHKADEVSEVRLVGEVDHELDEVSDVDYEEISKVREADE